MNTECVLYIMISVRAVHWKVRQAVSWCTSVDLEQLKGPQLFILCVCVCVCACVRACVRVCVHVCTIIPCYKILNKPNHMVTLDWCCHLQVQRNMLSCIHCQVPCNSCSQACIHTQVAGVVS